MELPSERAGDRQTEAKEAKIEPTLVSQFKALRLNAGVSDVAEQELLSPDVWIGSAETDGLPDRDGPCCWGVDCGQSESASGVAAYWPLTGRLESMGAFPETPTLAERGLSDGVGGLYVSAANRGELIQVGRHIADVPALLRAALHRFGKPDVVVADRVRIAELRQVLEDAKIPLATLQPRGMGSFMALWMFGIFGRPLSPFA